MNIPQISLSPNHSEHYGRAHVLHVGKCGCASEWNFHLLLPGYLAPAIRIQLFPEVEGKVKWDVLFERPKYNLEPQVENWGKKQLFGWLNHHWSSHHNPMQFLTTGLLFKKKCKWHIYSLCDLSGSQLAWCVGLCDPASGRAGRKWDRHLSDLLPFLLCLHPGRNPQDSSKRIAQSECRAARGGCGLAQG